MYPLASAFLWVSVTLTYPSILAIQVSKVHASTPFFQTLTLGEYAVNGFEKLFDLEDVWKKRLQHLIGYSVLCNAIEMLSTTHF